MSVRLLPSAIRVAFERWLSRDARVDSERVDVGRVFGFGDVPSRWLARPVRLPHGLLSVAVGGATLGGSGKTRVAMACSEFLANRGASVAFIGHAYGARPVRPRVVSPGDPLAEVGDEALVAASRFDALGLSDRVSVVVASSRQGAVDALAALGVRANVVVFDGPLQLAPVRASLALLAVDARRPWGSGRLFPAGDLRAPAEALKARVDEVVSVDASFAAISWKGARVELTDLPKGFRIGVLSAIARPERVVRAVSAVRPVHREVRLPNHGPLDGRSRRELLGASDVDLWILTEKCSHHLDEELRHRLRDRLGIVCDEFRLPEAACRRLRDLVPLGRPATEGDAT